MDNLEENALHAEEELYDNYPPQPEAEQDLPHEHFMDLHERARGIVELINLTMEGHQGQQPPAQQANQPNMVQQAVRLPTLELPRFDGEAHRYRTWWNAFSVAVDQQPTLSDFQKHTYLLMCLPANSPARKAIEHYEPSDTNYPRVLSILKDRFGDSKRLVDNLFSELMHLPRATESSTSLRVFSDTVDRICYQLESQGQSPDSTQTMLQIRSKLPPTVVRELLLREKDSRRQWTYKDLLKQLQEIISLKEEVFHCVHTMDDSPQVKKEKRPPQTPPRDTVRSFTASTQPQRFPPRWNSCSLCAKPGHLPSRCRVYQTPRDRIRRLIEMDRCIRCLREGHKARECHNQRTCQRCRGPHHLLVCQKAVENQNYHQETKSGHSNQQGQNKPTKARSSSLKPKTFKPTVAFVSEEHKAKRPQRDKLKHQIQYLACTLVGQPGKMLFCSPVILLSRHEDVEPRKMFVCSLIQGVWPAI
uniref:CCHC-type domain-containing protein n=1 Tax=Meloidogyne enterolobii TaxID=390850 RepID=A0A6V7UMJ9_MELEN|nr:unnamed protein product [Meloidogyne enterolobii]